jgi:hypothetical protein
MHSVYGRGDPAPTGAAADSFIARVVLETSSSIPDPVKNNGTRFLFPPPHPARSAKVGQVLSPSELPLREPAPDARLECLHWLSCLKGMISDHFFFCVHHEGSRDTWWTVLRRSGISSPQPAPLQAPLRLTPSRLVRLFTCQRAFGWPNWHHPYRDVSVRGRRIVPPRSFLSIPS